MMVHVPAILLSAAAEFDQAYDKGSNIKPKLSQISEYDQRAKSSSWYQPPVDARRPGISKGTLQAKKFMLLPPTPLFCLQLCPSLSSSRGYRSPCLISRSVATYAKIARKSAGCHPFCPAMLVTATKYRAQLQLSLWRKELYNII